MAPRCASVFDASTSGLACAATGGHAPTVWGGAWDTPCVLGVDQQVCHITLDALLLLGHWCSRGLLPRLPCAALCAAAG